MQDKKYNDTKKEIRSVLLTYKERVLLQDFLKTYRDLLGQRLPSRTLGFSTDVAFLQSMPDVVDVTTDSHGKVYLTGIADEASKHIQELVSKQRKTKPCNNKSNRRQPFRKLPDTSFKARELQPFLPGAVRAEILQLMSMYSDGVTLAAFALAYHKKYNKHLNLVKGLATLEGMIKLIPELEFRNENNERKIYHRNAPASVINNGKNESSLEQLKDNNDRESQVKNCFNIHESGIADDVLKSFQRVLQLCPDGILDIHFPPLYEKVAKKPFDLHEYGYSSIIELVDALPHIFKRTLNLEDSRQWIILPAKASVKHDSKVESSPSPSHKKKQSPLLLREGIPPDVSSPSLQYIQPTIPDDVNLNEYVPVFVSAIVNPNLFWFQLQTDEAIEKFERLEKDMGYFYNNYAFSKYQMKSADIAIGATCVVQCPDDQNWYRAVIQSIPSAKLVNVLFVDYGSRENVSRENLYYVRSKYHEYAACAFKAQLASVKPPRNASSWSIQAQKRFIQLCDTVILMAYIMPIDKDAYSVYLCNTNGQTDVHINDTLISEGYAEICHQNQFHVYNFSPSSEPEAIHNGHDIPFESDSDFSSSSSQFMSHSYNSEVIPESKALPVNRKLYFSAEEQENNLKPNAHYVEKGQNSKRYVKLLELCEDSKIHIINLENKLFMSCGDLCTVLWREKDSNCLIERLMYKEIVIPFLTIKEDDHVELFRQCMWFKIPDFEELDSSNPSVILCPLEEAFNVLNIFGHPSVCLRLAIQNEIRSFDPQDSFWNKFYEKSPDLDDVEKDIEQKLSKLCLYDLKAKYEAHKIKRIKLLRANSPSTSEELQKTETLLSVIERRMKQIEAICSQFSSSS